MSAVPRTRGVPPTSFTELVEPPVVAFTDGPTLRAQLIREGLLVPAADVERRPAVPFWHDAVPTLLLLGNEAGTRESYLPAEDRHQWRPRWHHAGSEAARGAC